MSDHEATAKQLGNRTCNDHNSDGRLAWVCLECVAAALAARDEEIAKLKAALDSVSFPDRRWK